VRQFALPRVTPIALDYFAGLERHPVQMRLRNATTVCVEDFHADPRVQATELLLQERVTRQLSVKPLRPAEMTYSDRSFLPEAATRLRTPHTLFPQAHFLSNGRYTTIVTNGGGGASVAHGRSLTRWRTDRTRDAGSQYYLRPAFALARKPL
jgi:hypothetical protein